MNDESQSFPTGSPTPLVDLSHNKNLASLTLLSLISPPDTFSLPWLVAVIATVKSKKVEHIRFLEHTIGGPSGWSSLDKLLSEDPRFENLRKVQVFHDRPQGEEEATTKRVSSKLPRLYSRGILKITRS